MRRLFMQAIRTKSIFLMQLANFFMLMILLFSSLWVLMGVVNRQYASTKLLMQLVECPYGSTVGVERSVSSSVTQAANYNPPPFKPGFNGLVTLVLSKRDKN